MILGLFKQYSTHVKHIAHIKQGITGETFTVRRKKARVDLDFVFSP